MSRGVECDEHLSGVVLSISRYGAAFYARRLQSVECAAPKLVDADGARHPCFGTERGGVTAKIRGCSAKSCGIRINVPQNFANSCDHRPARHTSTPSCL